MSKINLNMDTLKKFGAGLLASGKQNAPTLMTAGSILLGWGAAYIFWKQGKKAEKKIEAEEMRLNEGKDADIPVSQQEKLPVKDKFIIYLQYCWMAAAMGVGSTALAIGANKLNVSRLAEMALLTQFMNGKNEKQEKLIEKLKGEVGEKKFDAVKEEIREEQFPKSEVLEAMTTAPGDGSTLFIDCVTRNRWRGNIIDVTNAIAEFNKDLKEERQDAIKKRLGDAFFVSSESPWGIDEDNMSEVYSALDLEEFMRRIGELKYDNVSRLGDLLEFRYYGGPDPVKAVDILEYKNYEDPSTGLPVVCFIDYEELLSGTNELIERSY